VSAAPAASFKSACRQLDGMPAFQENDELLANRRDAQSAVRAMPC
jgi:hypothetical protein